MKIGILFLVVGIATACSSGPSKTTSASAKTAQTDDPNTGIICTYEKPTGSFLKEKRCTTAAERDAAKRQQGVLIDSRNERDSGIR
ncbi:MAG: hypothetical protein H7Y02_10760 [Candidatus Obscuribacterales bacterium]|nr:hypothetical protein [Steroidobacteraceae bacterium]